MTLTPVYFYISQVCEKKVHKVSEVLSYGTNSDNEADCSKIWNLYDFGKHEDK